MTMMVLIRMASTGSNVWMFASGPSWERLGDGFVRGLLLEAGFEFLKACTIPISSTSYLWIRCKFSLLQHPAHLPAATLLATIMNSPSERIGIQINSFLHKLSWLWFILLLFVLKQESFWDRSSYQGMSCCYNRSDHAVLRKNVENWDFGGGKQFHIR